MKYNYYLITLFVVILSLGANAQSSVHASGASNADNNGSITYSIRHVGFVQDDHSKGTISEGTAHPYEIFVFQYVEEKAITSLTIKAYPNPVVNMLHLEVKESDLNGLRFIITDINGKTIMSEDMKSNQVDINLEDNKSGVYFLTVTSELDKKFNTYKIIKR